MLGEVLPCFYTLWKGGTVGQEAVKLIYEMHEKRGNSTMNIVFPKTGTNFNESCQKKRFLSIFHFWCKKLLLAIL